MLRLLFNAALPILFSLVFPLAAFGWTDPISGSGGNVLATFMQYYSDTNESINNLHTGVDIGVTSGTAVVSGLTGENFGYFYPDSDDDFDGVFIGNNAWGAATDAVQYGHVDPNSNLEAGQLVYAVTRVGTTKTTGIHIEHFVGSSLTATSNSSLRNSLNTIPALAGYDSGDMVYENDPMPIWVYYEDERRYVLLIRVADKTPVECAPYSWQMSVGSYQQFVQFDQLGTHSASDFYIFDDNYGAITDDNNFWIKTEFVDESYQFYGVAALQDANFSLIVSDALSNSFSLGSDDVAYLINVAAAGNSCRFNSCTDLHIDIFDPWDSVEYLFQGSENLLNWVPLASAGRSRNGSYDVTLSSCMPFVRIVSVSEGGPRRVIWEGTPNASGNGGTSNFDFDSDPPKSDLLENFIAGGDLLANADKSSDKARGPGVLVFYPEAGAEWESHTQDLVSLYEYFTDYNVRTVGCLPGFTSADAAATRDLIIQEIQSSYEDYKYVHLVGDANDWEVFGSSGPLTDFYWGGEWSASRDSLVYSFAYINEGQASQNFIPTFVVADSDTVTTYGNVGTTMSAIYPYYFTDLPYADVDGDGLPDVCISRWPVSSPEEYLVMIGKLVHYLGQKHPSNGRFEVTSYLGDRDHIVGSTDGAHAAWINSLVLSETGEDQFLTPFVESEWLQAGGGNKLAATIDTWNSAPPDLAIMISSRSHRLDPSCMFNALPTDNWEAQFYLGGLPSVVLVPECGSAEFASTEAIYDNVVQTPVCERFLFENNWSGYGGAISWIGPTVGSWQESNGIVAQRIVRQMYENPNRPVAESFRLAIRGVLEEYSDDPIVATVARSFVFLGDPVSDFRRNSQLCDMEASNLSVHEVPEDCGTVNISWQTEVAIACDYSISLLEGDVLRTGVTSPSYSHGITYEGRKSVKYTVQVVPQCEGAIPVSDGWVIKVCVGRGTKGLVSIRTLGAFPNPFNPQVEIQYGIQTAGHASMTIYDVRGREIVELVDEFQPVGNYEIIWDGRDSSGGRVAAGVYFVQLVAPDIDQKMKIVMLK